MERTMHPYADERLILQTGQGDITALQRLFEQVYGAVYCYALSIVCDDWTAKCITEKTFLAVWEHARRASLDSESLSLAGENCGTGEGFGTEEPVCKENGMPLYESAPCRVAVTDASGDCFEGGHGTGAA